MSIKVKILIPTIVITLLVSAAILVSNILAFMSHVDETALETTGQGVSVAANRIEMLQAQAKTASQFIAADSRIAQALAAEDREALLTLAQNLQNETGVEFCTITDAEGNVFLRTHEPDNFGDSVAGQANIQSAIAGQTRTALETGTAVRLSIRSGAPVYDGQGAIVGVISVGFRLDQNQFVDSIKALTGTETTVFLSDERISTTVQNDDGTRATGTKAAENVSQTVLAGNTYAGEASILGRSAYATYIPITGSDGQVLGMLFSGQYTDSAAATIRSFMTSGVILTLVFLGASVAVLLFVTSRIVAPIRQMAQTAAALTAGDTDVEIHVKTRDEMRTLAEAFTSMIENTRRQTKIIEHIADGDLTVSLAVRSEKDVMNQAIISMLDLNNHVLSDISASADKVESGSRQIASSSQALAAGSTEQAASIQELSNSMAEIAEKTRTNAAKAEQAASLADSIKGNAAKGSEQMGEMMQSVREINEASQAIHKVIKTIDDIAFQTNILALNAAVEAARAGQHGKGFAVVAEEVRNLAQKSAEAAKDTEDLIATSMAKAETGVNIARATAESLAEIVSGINESGTFITEIADLSKEQSDGISQINSGIDQVAQVVQQNSAIAEESAASSEDMSSQATLLKGLIAQFKLKDDIALASKDVKRLPKRGMGGAAVLVGGAGEGFGKY